MTTLTINHPHRPALLNAVAGKLAAIRESRRIAKLERQIAAANAGRITIAEFLARLGADAAQIRSLEVGFGKAVANAYRAATGLEPEKTGLALVRGRAFEVNAYPWNLLEILTQAAANTPAVAALIGA